MTIDKLLKEAWRARGFAHPHKSGTKVGCAVLTDKGNVVSGWNIEGLWMTSIHAEVCAICNLVKLKEKAVLIAIVAKTELFTPCGACMDWLFQFATDNAKIIVQNKRKEIKEFSIKELMPYYPNQ